MKTTHIGKIGRLPRILREELGIRIEDGQDGQTILDWLNSQTEAQGILQLYFGGRPITAQNLSEWRQTGHQEWVRLQESIGYVNHLCEQNNRMEEHDFGEYVSDRLAGVLAGELMRTAEELREQTPDPRERWEQLCALNRELERLRKQDHQAAARRLAWVRWSCEMKELMAADREKQMEEARAEAIEKTLMEYGLTLEELTKIHQDNDEKERKRIKRERRRADALAKELQEDLAKEPGDELEEEPEEDSSPSRVDDGQQSMTNN